MRDEYQRAEWRCAVWLDLKRGTKMSCRSGFLGWWLLRPVGEVARGRRYRSPGGLVSMAVEDVEDLPLLVGCDLVGLTTELTVPRLKMP